MHVRSRSVPVLAALLVAACGTQAPRRPTTFQPTPPPVEASCQLDAVAYASRPGRAPEGSVSPMRLIIRPNYSRQVRIAVFEEYSGGTGDMWRASTWVGAVHAARVLQRNLGDYEISLSVGGLIDGPSAGALITAGMIAMMQGVPVRPDVTMTGTVNPDGTVGPVGGIAYKMQAAAAAGKRIFAYPRGQRFATDPETGQAIDLWALGSQLGLQVYEIADVEDAYAILTGYQLPRMQPVAPSQMVMSPALDARMRERIGAWVGEVAAGVREYQRQPPAVREMLRPRVEQALAFVEEADRFLRQGLVSMAYKRARDAAVYTSMMRQAGSMLQGILAFDFEPIFTEVEAMSAVEQELSSYFASLRGEPVATVEDASILLGAYEYGLQARAFVVKARIDVSVAEELLRRGQASPSEELITGAVGALTSAVAYYSGARMLLTIGKDGVGLRSGDAAHVPLDPYRLLDLARSTTVAAKAVVDYYEAVTVAGLADRMGVAPGRLRSHLLDRDADYRSAQLQAGFALEHREPRDVHEALMALAAAQRAFVDGSLLVMRDYSLGVEREDGRPVAVQNDLALMTALESADRRARESAALAAARLGRVPDHAAVAYERSRMLAEGDLGQRLTSLRGFWQAAQMSHTAVQIAAVPMR